jgi:hypothetical protein
MPLFDVLCNKCYIRTEQIIVCTDDFKINLNCVLCQEVTEHDILPPLTAMQPDNMWHNGQTSLGNFNTKKQYKDYIRNNNLERATRDNYESVQKKQERRLETIAQRNKEKLTKFIEKEIVHTIDLPEGK